MKQKWVVVMKPFRGAEPYESEDIVDASSWPGTRLQLLISQRYVRMATQDEADAATATVRQEAPKPAAPKKSGKRTKA